MKKIPLKKLAIVASALCLGCSAIAQETYLATGNNFYAPYATSYPAFFTPITINGAFIDANSVSNVNLSADLQSSISAANTAVQPAALATALSSVATTVQITNNFPMTSGAWYSNNMSFYIVVHEKITANLGLVAGNVGAQAWTKASLSSSSVTTNDDKTYNSLLSIAASPVKDTLNFEVPPHYVFCVTNSAATTGNSLTTREAVVTMLP